MNSFFQASCKTEHPRTASSLFVAVNPFAVVAILSLIAVSSIGTAAQAEQPDLPTVPTVIQHVTIVDVVSGSLFSKQTIVMSDGRIQQVGPDAGVAIHEDAQPMDGTGLYAIPGLWDMHVHWYDLDSMKLFPANGVCGVRVMAGMPLHHAWRKQFEAKSALGPRMLIASAIVDGARPIWPSVVAQTPEAAIRAVKSAVETDADFVKAYSLLPRDSFFALLEEAKRQKIPVDGHVPKMVSIAEASDAGMRCMEHLYEFMLSCSSEETILRKQLEDIVAPSGEVRTLFDDREFMQRNVRRAYETYDPAKAALLFRKLRNHGTWQCPTLTVLRNLAFISDESVRGNPNVKYLPDAMARMVAPDKDPRGRTEQELAFSQLLFRKNLEILQQMHEAGVSLLSGTDCLNPYCLPGFSLHEELQLLVEAGLSPLEALRTSTLQPARFMGRETEMGTLEVGKVADLVLLRANPLEDISRTTQIETVVLRGQVLRRDALEKILAEAEQR